MKSASVGELKENLDQFLELVRSGERIEIMDGKERVACLEPVKTIEEIVEMQIARGVLKPGKGELPDDFFTRPRPAGGASVLEALLEDRRTGPGPKGRDPSAQGNALGSQTP